MKPKLGDPPIDDAAPATSHVDDFDVEVELLKNDPAFMALMKQRSQEKAAISFRICGGNWASNR